MIIDYLTNYTKLKQLEGYLNGKKRKQLQKLEQWLSMEQHRQEKYNMSMVGLEF